MIGNIYKAAVVKTYSIPGPVAGTVLQRSEVVYEPAGTVYGVTPELAKASVLAESIVAKKVDPLDGTCTIEVKLLAFT